MWLTAQPCSRSFFKSSYLGKVPWRVDYQESGPGLCKNSKTKILYPHSAYFVCQNFVCKKLTFLDFLWQYTTSITDKWTAFQSYWATERDGTTLRQETRNEPPHNKTNKMACAPSEDLDQPGHPPSLIRVFTIRMKKVWVLSYPLSAQRRLWSDRADAQADLSLRWAHMPLCWFCHEVAQMWKRKVYFSVK